MARARKENRNGRRKRKESKNGVDKKSKDKDKWTKNDLLTVFVLVVDDASRQQGRMWGGIKNEKEREKESRGLLLSQPLLKT